MADAGAVDLVLAHPVLGQLVEEVGQRVAPILRMPRGRQLEAALLLLDEPGLLEHLGQLGQALEGLRGVVAQQLAGRSMSTSASAPGDVAERSRFSSWSMSPSSFISDAASAKPSGSWPAEVVALLPARVGERLAEVGGEPVDLPAQVHVLQQLVGQALELRPLLGRHRVEHRLHGRHLLRHLLEQLVEGLRVAGEEVAELLHEALEGDVGVLAALALLEHAR